MGLKQGGCDLSGAAATTTTGGQAHRMELTLRRLRATVAGTRAVPGFAMLRGLARGLAVEVADAAFASLSLLRLVGSERMPAEAVSHHGDGAGPVLGLVARGEELHDRLRDHRDGYLHAESIADEPVHLSSVLDVARKVPQSVVLAIGGFHQVDQP